MDDKPVTGWLRTALWRSLHCYICAFVLFAALGVPYTVRCVGKIQFDWVAGIIGATAIWGFWAFMPALVLGSLCAFAPVNVWKWMRLTFIGLAVLWAIVELAAPASWWSC